MFDSLSRPSWSSSLHKIFLVLMRDLGVIRDKQSLLDAHLQYLKAGHVMLYIVASNVNLGPILRYSLLIRFPLQAKVVT